MTVKLLTGLYFEFLGLKGGCTGSSESIHVKLPHSRLEISCHGSLMNELITTESSPYNGQQPKPAERMTKVNFRVLLKLLRSYFFLFDMITNTKFQIALMFLKLVQFSSKICILLVSNKIRFKAIHHLQYRENVGFSLYCACG